eukprot:Seg2836.1 transcript_id=Seg2836.1/GoldUCD/mRNA.D3Y31 product="hypothetical protein" protein_id=Seg2836.1/GoldUCD/D3Y31
MPPEGISARAGTRASTASSSTAGGTANASSSAANASNSSSAGEAATAPLNNGALTSEQLVQVSTVVQEAIMAAFRQPPAVSRTEQHPPTAVQGPSNPPAAATITIPALGEQMDNFCSTGQASLPFHVTPQAVQFPQQASFTLDGGFADIPQQMVDSI